MLLLGALVGCGGGGANSPDTEVPTTPLSVRSVSASAAPSTDTEAHRFLIQATFGPSAQDLARVKSIGYARWIDEQWSRQLSSTHLSTVEASATVMQTGWPRAEDVVYSWWTHAVRDPAQLRQRVAFALSEIFVVSTVSLENGRNVASYLDMLTTHADGRYRDLLESVTMHPAMGQYLSHLTNRKADAASGRVPDENFAREVMQLFSIGLYELDDAARPKTVDGMPVESYSASDIKGLARVFTGASWFRPPDKASLPWYRCFWHAADCQDTSQEVSSMSLYAEAHEPGEKSFLGVTLAAQPAATPATSVKAALDRLASHPNTAPFLSKQLIQRLVTSNPSAQYVSDITAVFRNTGGNLGQVVKAILLHTEARNPPPTLEGGSFGKLREPVLRMTHLLRALPHRSDRYEANIAAGSRPFYVIDDTSDPGSALGQTPLRAPSVFNFFRPGYVPPQTAFSEAGLVAPEMQITSETSVLGYVNFAAASLNDGFGRWNGGLQRRDVQFDFSRWEGLANNPSSLVNAAATTLLGRPLPPDTHDAIVAAVQTMSQASATQRRQRVQAAFLAIAVLPDFIVQQ